MYFQNSSFFLSVGIGAYHIVDPVLTIAEELQRLPLKRKTFYTLTSTNLLHRTIDKDY